MQRGLALVLLAVAGCGGADANTDVSVPAETLPLAESEMATTTGPATDLAPSQIAASTVPRPATPPPCDVDDLTFWTAQVIVGETTSDAVIRFRNDGDAWCEADVSGSPLIDPAIEPDVWLEPGDWADLLAGQREPGCVAPATETLLQLDVNGQAVVVPTALVTCGWWLSAFYPNDLATEPCTADGLDLVVTESGLIVRNASFVPCELGAVAEVVGAESSSADPTSVQITTLAGGDVVSYGLSAVEAVGCSAGTATVVFAAAGPIDVPGLGGCFIVELGAAGPWFDAVDGPLSGWPGADVDMALMALDPFADGT